MAQQLQSFTRRMMERTVQAHSTATEHDRHCCQVAHEYADRLGMQRTAIPAAKVPAPRSTPGPAPIAVLPISPAQARYIRNLRRKISLELLSPQHRLLVDQVCNGDEITRHNAGDLLEAMISLADQTPSARSRPEPSYIPEEGPYKVGDDIFLVVTAKETDRRYAKQFNPETHKFFYAGQRPFGRLTQDCRMTAEDAKQFGDLYKCCCSCGRHLTKDHSKDLGYGPTCADNNGWPY
jgi:hypothetical protein